ncbi:MAG: hypothetical protein QN194_15875 [Armatimonadota bacterium]|nr:hypothetical protein [Armatimonadota bacterium]
MGRFVAVLMGLWALVFLLAERPEIIGWVRILTGLGLGLPIPALPSLAALIR